MRPPRRRRCAGFVRSPAYEEMWTPCLDDALPRDTLCRSHREGLDGALLSLANFENSPRFTHVSQTEHLSKTARKRKFSRRRTSVNIERALVEGVPHLQISLGEIRAASKFGPGAEDHECTACSDHRGEPLDEIVTQGPRESAPRSPVPRRSREENQSPQAYEAR